MFSFCAISHKPPINPVFSPTTSLIYEKNLILNTKNQTTNDEIICPITNSIFKASELIDVKGEFSRLPRSIKNCNIKDLIHELVASFNSSIISKQELINEVESKQKELSHSIYRYEAGVRVLSKLNKEISSLRSKLANLQDYYDTYNTIDDEYISKEEINNNSSNIQGISHEIISDFVYFSKEASMMRNSKKIKIKSLSNINLNLNLLNNEVKLDENDYITSFDVSKKLEKVLFGDILGNVFLFTDESKKVIKTKSKVNSKSNDTEVKQSLFKLNNFSSEKSFKKRVSDVGFMKSNESFFAVSSMDNTVGIFGIGISDKKEDISLIHKLESHSQGVTGLSFQPFSEYILLSSLDKNYSFHNTVKVSYKLFLFFIKFNVRMFA